MPLTKVEKDICQFVVHRLLNEGEVTRRQALLKQFRGSLADALRKLLDRSVLRGVEQVSGNETYLPRAIAFHYCLQPDAEELARNSTETVLRVLQVMYEQELDKEPQLQRQFSPSDVEAEAHNLELKLDSQMTRIGLYISDELGIFPSLQRDSNLVFLKSFHIGEHIYEVLKNSNPWDLLVERGRISVENYPYGRSLDSIDISEQPQNISDLPKKEKLIADVGSFLTRKAGIALLVIDLDHFKTVNDTKGHQEGDACLERVVKTIGSVLGRKGILYRWGGDEFAVSLPDFSTIEAHATAERIRSAMEQAKPGIDLPVTTSIGVSGNDQMTNASAEELLEAADKAMYMSKQQGKNRVTSWSVANLGERLSKYNLERKDQPVSMKILSPPKLRVALKRGHASNFLIEYSNDEEEPIFIRATRLFAGTTETGKVEISDPITPDNPNDWKVQPHSSQTFGKIIAHQKNPGASLVRMNQNAGIFFNTYIDFVVGIEMRGQPYEVRQTIYVEVNATNSELVPLV
jgi:diguanylate cyclase (GGDEF)-like protein